MLNKIGNRWHVMSLLCVAIAVFVIGLSAISPTTNQKLKNFFSPAKLTAVEIADRKKQIDCLARNIYFEAKGEGELGMAAVAVVVRNRIESGFADTACQVVYQRDRRVSVSRSGQPQIVKVCQFSWTCDRNRRVRDQQLYMLSQSIAKAVLYNNAYPDLFPDNVLFYHANYVNPRWPYKRYAKIGNHIFYVLEETKLKTKT